AEGAQQVGLLGIGLGESLAVADARHLGAALVAAPRRARNVMEIFGMARIGDVDDRGAVVLAPAGERVHRPLIALLAAELADIGDPAPVLLMDHRRVGGTPLEI